MRTMTNFGVDYTGQLKSGDPASDLPPIGTISPLRVFGFFSDGTPFGDFRRSSLAANFQTRVHPTSVRTIEYHVELFKYFELEYF